MLEERNIFYFSKEGSDKPKGVIRMVAGTDVVIEEKYSKPFCFTLVTPKKKFILQAANEDECVCAGGEERTRPLAHAGAPADPLPPPPPPAPALPSLLPRRMCDWIEAIQNNLENCEDGGDDGFDGLDDDG